MTEPVSFPGCDIFVPDGVGLSQALERSSHMGIMAHSDDLEFWAYHGIEACVDSADQWFAGVTLTDGAGSVLPPRIASREELVEVRRAEQRRAAELGRYSIMLQPGIPSAALMGALREDVVAFLRGVLRTARPEVLYLHNPFDRHVTHLAVLRHCVAALRGLEAGERPKLVLGCEGWRDLDWLPKARKKLLSVGRLPELARELCAVFQSQTAEKNYCLAVEGRRASQATFQEARQSDALNSCTLAIDLSEIVDPHGPEIDVFIDLVLAEFRAEIGTQWGECSGTS